MIARRITLAVAAWLGFLGCASPCRSQVIGVYDFGRLSVEGARLEARARGLWKVIHDKLLTGEEQEALRHARFDFPPLSPDGSLLNFYADSREAVVTLPLHSLLLLEDICVAYAWLYRNNRDLATITEYAAVLKYRNPAGLPGGRIPPPWEVLGIPADALKDKQVDQLSLRFRNSAYAFVIAHEMGHILRQHPGNRAVRAEVSRAHERQADEFALLVLERDHQIPMGAILFFQMTAFTASPGRFDYRNVAAWQNALREATHPVTSDRVRGMAEGLGARADRFGVNREAALFVAKRLWKIAAEMDDRDWSLYFKRIGEGAPLQALGPREPPPRPAAPAVPD